MVHSIKLKRIGGSGAAILPKEFLQRQHLAAYAQVARENRAALAALAKL